IAQIVATALRPSRPSTKGARFARIAATKSPNCFAWPTCEIAAGSLDPPLAPTFCANRFLTSSSSGVGGLKSQRKTSSCSTTAELPGAAPAALVVVLLRPPPLAGRLAQRQSAEPPGVHGGLQRQVRVGEARREDGAELGAVLIAGVDDGVAALDRDL